jgi:isocitrate dehydrogenase
MSNTSSITVAHGDGIGPEIMDATLKVLKAAGARLNYEEIEIGEKQYLAGHNSGISPEDWKTLLKNRVFLKAPITTPLGSGYKSLNVTVRKSLRLFSNVRPCRAYAPYVNTNFRKSTWSSFVKTRRTFMPESSTSKPMKWCRR